MKKASIRICRIYNTVSWPAEYMVAKETTIKDLIKEIQDNPERIIFKQQHADKLYRSPTMDYRLVNEINEKIPVLCEVTFRYTSIVVPQKMDPVTRAG